MAVMEKSKIIRRIPLFSQLDDDQIEMLAQIASVEEIPEGGLYFSEESAAKGFHVLLSGRVKLFKTSEEGKEQTLYLFGPGEPFCLCSVFSDGQQPANLAALERSRVLVLAADLFERLTRDDPSLLLAVLRVMSYRLKEAMTMIDSLSLKPVASRLAAYFLAHAQKSSVHLGITHREFAKVIGVTPEALSRSLNKMVKAGLVRVEGGTIHLENVDALALCRDGAGSV